MVGIKVMRHKFKTNHNSAVLKEIDALMHSWKLYFCVKGININKVDKSLHKSIQLEKKNQLLYTVKHWATALRKETLNKAIDRQV